MKLQEFITKGYKINAQVKVIKTEDVHLDWLLDGTDIDECRGDTTDFFHYIHINMPLFCHFPAAQSATKYWMLRISAPAHR